MRVLRQQQLFSIVNHMLVDYRVPSNISYLWNFGVLAGVCLAIQIVTGILLAMHYTPHVDIAFASIEHIMRDVNYGWILRYVHANGASMFFIVVYTHMFRGLYYGSYLPPRQLLWWSGVVILLLMMATGFMGYVLPWGQMSFWGATVITNLFSALPLVGESIAYWLWGGFSVGHATLNKFFSLHYLLPFVIAAVAGVHVILLHEHGSNNPLGIYSKEDKVPFHPYFTLKDLTGVLGFIVFFSVFVFYYPNLLNHPDNYIEANPMVTPAHIVPEWYFLPYYAILRSIPDKLGGVLAMFGSILVFLLLPFINNSNVRSSAFRPLYKKLFWFFLADCFLLGWLGGQPIETPFIQIGQIGTIFYFGYLLVILPGLGMLEMALLRTDKK